MSYPLLLSLHVSTVLVSLCLFLLRSYWLLNDSLRLRQGWIKTLPHINDSILFFAAIGMAVSAGFKPSEQPWLMAKIIGLLIYITLGMIALHGRHARGTRMAAMLAALAVYTYVVSVAISKQVLPGLGG